MSILEWIAAIAGAVSVYLSARENIWSWPTGIVNVGLYIIVFERTGLYSDMGLQIVFLILSIYGWYQWLYGGKNRTELTVSRASLRDWLVSIPIAIVFWIIVDIVYVPMYVYKHLPVTAALYVGFLILAVMGLRAWWRSHRQQPAGEPLPA